MELLSSIFEFIKTLTLVDVVFFAAVIVLLILIVTLIYFIKINKNVFTEDDFFSSDNIKKEEKKEATNLIEEIALNNVKEQETYNDEEEELIDLNTLTEKLKKEETERVDVTDYERDQEEKAIISYDELLKKHNNYSINYEEEKVIDDVVVKKINLNDLINTNETDNTINERVRIVSYDKEEAFLNALKELNSLLN